MKGIDVSAWQSYIDWDKVKNDGIDFAMIRIACGTKIDSWATRNIIQCIRVGIKFGVYIYSYALNLSQAEKEANLVVQVLEPYRNNVNFPVVIDMEDADSYKKKNGMPLNQVLVEICKKECEVFEKAGYIPAIYASKSWFDNQLYSAELEKYEKWLAWWYKDAKFDKGRYGIWQYSDAGRVDGIKGNVDMNEAYKDYSKFILKKEAKNMLEKLIENYGTEAVEKAFRKLIESANDDGLPSTWAEEEVKKAKELGITDGTNPEMFTTRQETAAMIVRALKTTHED